MVRATLSVWDGITARTRVEVRPGDERWSPHVALVVTHEGAGVEIITDSPVWLEEMESAVREAREALEARIAEDNREAAA